MLDHIPEVGEVFLWPSDSDRVSSPTDVGVVVERYINRGREMIRIRWYPITYTKDSFETLYDAKSLSIEYCNPYDGTEADLAMLVLASQ